MAVQQPDLLFFLYFMFHIQLRHNVYLSLYTHKNNIKCAYTNLLDDFFSSVLSTAFIQKYITQIINNYFEEYTHTYILYYQTFKILNKIIKIPRLLLLLFQYTIQAKMLIVLVFFFRQLKIVRKYFVVILHYKKCLYFIYKSYKENKHTCLLLTYIRYIYYT